MMMPEVVFSDLEDPGRLAFLRKLRSSPFAVQPGGKVLGVSGSQDAEPGDKKSEED